MSSLHQQPASFPRAGLVNTPNRIAHTIENRSDLADTASQSGTQSLPPPQLPRLVAEQLVPIAANDKDTQRLVVVLSNASLETYRASHGGRTGGKEEKYSLLNSDEHIGVMRKMNRDISDARPDITHQVRITMQLSLIAATS
jgi:rRNA small subunit pseudouridine methyltransferase Nep1